MNAISKRLLSWLCVIAMVLSFAPVMDLSNFAVETNAAAGDANLADVDQAIITQMNKGNSIDNSDEYFQTECLAKNYCPICGEGVTWTALAQGGKATGGHVYIGDDTTSIVSLYTSSTLCLWLNKDVSIDNYIRTGTDITVNVFGEHALTASSSRVVDIRNNGTLNLYGGKIVPAAANTRGAIYFYTKAGTVNMYAGATIGPDAPAANTAYRNVFMRSSTANTFNMYGGTIQNGVGTGVGTGATSTEEHAVSGNIDILAAGTFNMYGGTIKGGTFLESAANKTGGNIWTQEGAKVNIYGGTIQDGEAEQGGNIYVNRSNADATTAVNMYGGTIQNGDAAYGGNVYIHGASSYGGKLNVSGTAKIAGGGTKTTTDGEVTYSSTNGGNVYVSGAGATLKMTGGTITGGKASAGGNVYTINSGYSTFDFQGGAVTNGEANNGGNVYAYGVFKMSQNIAGVSTVIAGGTASDLGGNLYLRTSGRNYTITGGTIVGDIEGKNYSLVVSGAPKIVTSAQVDGETVTAEEGLVVTSGSSVDISGLTAGAQIAFTADVGTTLTAAYTGVQAMADAGYFSMTDAGTEISVEGDQLVVAEAQIPEVVVPAKPAAVNPGDANLASLSNDEWAQMYKGNNIDNSDNYFETVCLAKGYCPICGKGVTWTEWEPAGGESALAAQTLETGAQHVYVDGTFDVNTINVKTDAALCIWLKNDANLSVLADGWVRASSTLNFFGTGAIKDENGAMFLDVRAGGKLNLYGGNFVYKNTAGDTASAVIEFAYPNADSVVNIYNGATIGPKTPVAGAVYMNVLYHADRVGTINMYGGTIQNGVGPAVGISGNVNVGNKGTFNMYGGTIKGGTYVEGVEDTVGGNVYTAEGADVNIYGGTIENGVAEQGGNIYVNRKAVVDMCGGTITGGEATNGGNAFIYGASSYGGKLAVSGTALISDGGTKTTVEEEVTYSVSSGGNVYVGAAGSELEMTGGKITGGIAKNGGNVYTADSGYSTFTFQGGAVTNGDASRGGNLYMNGKVNMSQNIAGVTTTLSGGNAEYGGNIYLRYRTSTMTGGTIENGVSVGGGGNLYIHSDATFTMTGGVCAHGDTTKTGQTKGSANILINGSTSFNGGNVDTGTVVLKDGYDVWYPTNADALNAYNAQTSQYVTLSGEAALNGHEVVIDVKGREVTLTGTGSITLIDTTNLAFEKFGEVTIADGASINFAEETFVGNDHYVTIQDGSKLSAHYVEMKLTHITLRTTANGLYYKVQIKCDDTLAGRVKTFGVVVDTDAQPTNLVDFQNYSISSVFVPVDNTVSATSLDVFNILGDRDAATNYEFLKTKVYANLYMKVNVTGDDADGYAVMGLKAGTTVGKSLLEVVQGIDAAWATIAATDAAKAKMKEFVQNWAEAAKLTADGVAEWNDATSNIVAS